MNDSGSQFFKSEFKYSPLVSSHEIQLSDIKLFIIVFEFKQVLQFSSQGWKKIIF